MTRALLLLGVVSLLLGPACASGSAAPAGRPTASAPALAPGLRSLGAGVLDINLDPNAVRDLDPLNMALNLGVTPPSCADFVMAFSWQIRQPDPAGDARVGFTGERMGGKFEVGAPAVSGEATIGCALLQAVNPTPSVVVVQVRFVVATARR